VSRLVARGWVVEALVCVPVELLVEAEPTTAVSEVVLDTLERSCDRRCPQFVSRPRGVDVDPEVDIPRANIRAVVGRLEAVRDLEVDRPPAE
jgi:hypothetical protein